jgi:hypothetical protein
MIAFKPVPLKIQSGRNARPLPPSPFVMGQSSATATPRFAIDDNWGLGGILAAAMVLSVTGLAAYSGIKAGLKETDKTQKTINLFFGIGSAVLGLLYLGGRLNAGAPAIRITRN